MYIVSDTQEAVQAQGPHSATLTSCTGHNPFKLQSTSNDRARLYRTTPIQDGEYEQFVHPTFERAPTTYVVDLVGTTCSCRRFQSQGFPCYHAISAIVISGPGVKASLFAEDVFKTTEYAATYAAPIYPPVLMSNEVPEFEDSALGLRFLHGTVDDNADSESDDTPALLPPDVKRKPGWPRKNRI
jgi:SWIM zinc finger